MKHSQKVFLEQFEQPIRKYIIEFCNQISKKQYDVLILLARKAACFLSSLEDLELITLNGKVVSDRVLEYDTEWLKGKNIAIIDDTIISGTSICKIINKIKKINVQNISVHTFCINEYWFVGEMLEDDLEDGKKQKYLLPPFIKLDHTSSLRFCKQIVNALSIVPRPYNIDFPIYEKIKFTTKNYLAMLEDKCWKIINTATQLQTNNNINSISLNPTREILSEFNESLGADYKDILFIKLRIYSEETLEARGQPNYLCKVVPFVIFNPIKIEFADALIEAICNCEKMETRMLSCQLITETSKLLFIQYYFAARLFRWWLEYIEKIIEKELRYAIVDDRSLHMLFSPQIIEMMSNFTFNQKIDFDPKKYCDFFEYENVTYSKNNEPINPLLIKDELLKPFLIFYYKRELFARRNAKEKGKEALKEILEDADVTNYMNRLEEGISMIDLKKIISEFINNSTDANLILSSFLDNGIDLGLIVPITIHKEKYLCRGFRHGEEIVWGVNNDKLLAIFYKQFLGKEKSLSDFWFEKLLVLFLKLGLKDNILEEFNLSTPPNQKVSIIGIRSYLQGQVTVSYEIKPNKEIKYNPILNYETKEYWTFKKLSDLKVFQKNDKGGYNFNFDKLFYKTYETDKKIGEVEDLDPHLERKAKDIADLLKLCKEKKLLNDNDLVKLTSCLNLHDNTASIGAELNLFNMNLESYTNIIRSGYNDLTMDFLDSLRDKSENYLWMAINSGREKYLDFKQGEGISLTKEITKQLNIINPFAERAWEEYWEKDIELIKNKDEENELWMINDRMGIILIDINSSIIYIHILLYILLKKQSKIDDFKKQLIEIIQSYKDELVNKESQLNVFHKNSSQMQIDFDNAIIIQNNEREIKEIKNKINSITKKIEYWDSYIPKNIKRIKSNSQELSKKNNARLKSQGLILKILSDNYQNFSEQEIWQEINEAINILYDLQKDSKDSLKEFSLIVPQFGKIQRTVKYSSAIHLNCLSTDHIEREKLFTIIKKELAEFELKEYDEQTNDKSIVLLNIDDVNPDQGYILGGKGQFHFERLLKLSCRILWICRKRQLKVIISLIPFDKDIKAYFNNGTKIYDKINENLYNKLPKNSAENQIRIYGVDENRILKLRQTGVLRNVLTHFEISVIEKDISYSIKVNEDKPIAETEEIVKNVYLPIFESHNLHENLTLKERQAREFYLRIKNRINSNIFSKLEDSIIIKWFSNFIDDNEREYMLPILNGITIIDETKVEEIINKWRDFILNYLRGDFDSLFFSTLEETSASSGTPYLYTLVQKLGLNKETCVQINNVPNNAKTIIFIDDIIGSGNQAYENVKTINTRYPNAKKLLFSLVGQEDGIQKLSESGMFKKNGVQCGISLTDECRIFSENSTILIGLNEADRQKTKTICTEYGKKLYSEHPLGYNDSQLLITFLQHNTPNNSLPIIWAGPASGQMHWNPLFARITPHRIHSSDK